MSKSWLKKLASDVEKRYGKDARDRIFGDLDTINKTNKTHEFISAWFDNFINGMDALNDKEFLQTMMANRCPCGGNDSSREGWGKEIKRNYDKSESLEEFVASMDFGDEKELRGNVLYLTKYPMKSKVTGSCGKGCHCAVARHTNKFISDIFCYCCTVGHTGIPFQKAFGENTKIEFIDSLIIGGKGCTVAIHLPEKHSTGYGKD